MKFNKFREESLFRVVGVIDADGNNVDLKDATTILVVSLSGPLKGSTRPYPRSAFKEVEVGDEFTEVTQRYEGRDSEWGDDGPVMFTGRVESVSEGMVHATVVERREPHLAHISLKMKDLGKEVFEGDHITVSFGKEGMDVQHEPAPEPTEEDHKRAEELFP